jgi:hypothetical protein
MEAAIAKISADRKAVEADPAAAVRASLDDAMTQARQRLRRVLLTPALAAALALLIYLRAC